MLRGLSDNLLDTKQSLAKTGTPNSLRHPGWAKTVGLATSTLGREIALLAAILLVALALRLYQSARIPAQTDS